VEASANGSRTHGTADEPRLIGFFMK